MFGFSSISGGIKRYIWQILPTASLILAPLTTPIQSLITGFLALRTSLDFWNYFNFKSYSLINENKQPRTWQNILQEFSEKNRPIAFFGFTRENISQEIEKTMMDREIKPAINNLCGPIAFLNVLIIHDPALFVKTICEYAENGCTYAPFYLQSSFWDRYLPPVKRKNGAWKNKNHYVDYNIFELAKSYNSFCLALAGSFKNTHNLLGYNGTCLFECFKGYTEPKKIREWLSQAGFQSSSNVTIHNYRNTGEMPWLSRFILGGNIYDKDNQKGSYHHKPSQPKPPLSLIELSQELGNTPIHYVFDVAKGHWKTFSDNQGRATDNCIQVYSSNRSKIM